MTKKTAVTGIYFKTWEGAYNRWVKNEKLWGNGRFVIIHSKKPKKMYEYIEDRTNGARIELFAREKRDGWSVWGLDIKEK